MTSYFSNLVQNPNQFSGLGNIFTSDFVEGLRNMVPNQEHHADWLLKSVEDVILLAYLMGSAPTNAERVRHALAYIKYTSKASATLKARHFLGKFLDKIIKELSDINEYVPQAGVRSMLDNWDRMDESPLAEKLRNMASYCMAFSVLERCGFHQEFAEIIYSEFKVRKETKKVTSFLYAIIDVVEFVISRAKVCYQAQSFAPLFHTETSYSKWCDLVDTVRLQSKQLLHPELGGFSEPEYYNNVDKALKEGKARLPFAKTRREQQSINQIISELEMLKHDTLVTRKCSSMRKTPFAVLLFGNTSIGKTSIADMIGKRYSQLRKLPYSAEYIYTKNPYDDFFSSYTSQMWCVNLDDVACLSPNNINGIDTSVEQLMQMLNCAVFVTNQAELDKKGKVPFTSELVILSSNVKDMNCFHYFSHPSAVQRRINFVVQPIVKAEFRVSPEIDQLDGDKAKAWTADQMAAGRTNVMPDFWSFEITEWIPASVGGEKRLATEHYPFGRGNFVSLKRFIKYFDNCVLSHHAKQEAMLRNVANMRESRVCGECSLPISLCSDDSHRAYDDMECVQCHNIDCAFKNGCFICEKCLIPQRKCRHYQPLETAIEQEREDLYDEQCELVVKFTGRICQNCNHIDCLWKDYPKACSTICHTCGTCISDEDILDDYCTRCEIYDVQSSFTYTEMFLFWLVAFWIQLQNSKTLGYRALMPAAVSEQRMIIQNDAEQVGNVYFRYLEIRKTLAAMGKRVSEELSSRPIMKVFSAFLSVLSVVKAGAFMWDKWSNLGSAFEAQVGVYKTPEPTDNEGFNVWKRDDYVLSPLDTGRMVKSYKSLPLEQLVQIIGRNLVHLKVHRSQVEYMNTKAFCICDRYYLINKHVIPQGIFNIDILHEATTKGVTNNVLGVKITPEQISEFDGDVVIIFIPVLAPKKDLRELFSFKSLNSNMNGLYVTRSEDGEIHQIDVDNINKHSVVHPSLNNGDGFIGYEGFVKIPTKVGFCGSILIGRTHHGPTILGIHCLGSPKGGVISCQVDKDQIHYYFAKKYIVDTGDIVLKAENCGFELQSLNPKSVVRYIEENGSARVCGSLSGHRSSGKSMVRETMISPLLVEKYNFTIKHSQPDLRSYRPWRLSIQPMVEQQFPLDYHKVKTAVEAYFSDVKLRVPKDEWNLLEAYDMETAINGQDNVQYVDRMDMNTSMGFPWCKSKKHFFNPTNKDGRTSHVMIPIPEIQEAVEINLSKIRRGIRSNPVFQGSLKDEAREHEKVLEGNTRVFSGQPGWFGIIARMHYMSFVRLIQRNRLDFECAVGTNTHSQDWDKIAHYLEDFSSHVFDGDYKKYDKSMMGMVIAAIFDGIVNLHAEMSDKFDDEMLLAMTTIGYDIAYAWVNFNGDLMTFLRHNPSGHLLTVIINSICGSVYLRIGYADVTGDSQMKSFSHNVRPITYGDDVVVSVGKNISNQFNFTTYRKALARYNIIFTPADKKSGDYTYKTLDKVDFLKRTFVFDDNLKRYIAPLAISSIHKSMLVCTASKSITHEKQIISILSSAHREMWMHGKDKFVEFVNITKDILTVYNLHIYVGKSDFPSYQELDEYYKQEVSTSAWGKCDEKHFLDYEIQGLRQEVPIKPKLSSMYSYCIEHHEHVQNENGYMPDTRKGVPQSTFLGKIPLVIKMFNLCVLIVLYAHLYNQTAETIKENFKNMAVEGAINPSTISDINQSQRTELDATQSNITKIRNDLNDDYYNFLNRPVEIRANILTASSTPITSHLDVFGLWRSSSAVTRKLANYQYIRGTFHCKITVDATPFVYGAIGSSLVGTAFRAPSNALYHISQRDHSWLHVGYDEDLELSCPLLFKGEWADIDTQSVILTTSVPYFMKSTASSTLSVTYRLYAWMTDIELSGPTWHVQSQTVTTVKDINKSTTKHPMTLGSDKLKIEDVPCMPMKISELCGTYPVVDTFEWSGTTSGGDILARYDITPSLHRVNVSNVNMTPLSLLARFFRKWRGGLKFRFRFITSRYHAGSVRITWDPYLTDVGDGATGTVNTVKTLIHNLREGSVVDFEVPYVQSEHAKFTDFGEDFFFLHCNPIDQAREDHVNGRLTVKVFTNITSPESVSLVNCMVSVIPMEDFAFMEPIGDDFSGTQAVPTFVGGYTPQSESVFSQEYITDLGELIKRPVLNSSLTTTLSQPGYYSVPILWKQYGVEYNSGSFVAKRTSVVTAGSPTVTSYERSDQPVHVLSSPLWGYFVFSSVGTRGSMRHIYIGNNPNDYLILSHRKNSYVSDLLINGSTDIETTSTTTPSHLAIKSYSMRASTALSTFCGAQLSGGGVSCILEADVPHLSGDRYNEYGNNIESTVGAISLFSSSNILQYVAAGDDFQFVMFLGLYPMSSLNLRGEPVLTTPGTYVNYGVQNMVWPINP